MGSDKKRGAEGASPGGEKKKTKRVEESVNLQRMRKLNQAAISKDGPVIYWMGRDQRVRDNWALIYAAQKAAAAGQPLAIAFNLPASFDGRRQWARQVNFQLRGLREMQTKLAELKIPFFLLRGDATKTIPKLVEDTKAGLVVTDFYPMRDETAERDALASAVGVAVHQIDAHNIVPVWEASPKQEYAARTIRPKITARLKEFLTEFPTVQPLKASWEGPTPPKADWESLIAEASKGTCGEVPEVAWCAPGEAAAMAALVGEMGSFLSKGRYPAYDSKRNDPVQPMAQSNLSPYFRHGQLAPQRAALAATESQWRKSYPKSTEGFIEELVIRRELSDNWCFYNPQYDSLEGCSKWATDSLKLHAKDKREYVYTLAQLEGAKTHDELWNAAQDEVVHRGKMHGFMRMYWAKKILEWTEGPEQALEYALLLNDKYNIDGFCPNGVVGCMWSIAGVHDMGWTERPVFGKIRFMNYAGCKRKFKIEEYCSYVKKNKSMKGAATWGSLLPPAGANIKKEVKTEVKTEV